MKFMPRTLFHQFRYKFVLSLLASLSLFVFFIAILTLRSIETASPDHLQRNIIQSDLMINTSHFDSQILPPSQIHPSDNFISYGPDRWIVIYMLLDTKSQMIITTLFKHLQTKNTPIFISPQQGFVFEHLRDGP